MVEGGIVISGGLIWERDFVSSLLLVREWNGNGDSIVFESQYRLVVVCHVAVA